MLNSTMNQYDEVKNELFRRAKDYIVKTKGYVAVNYLVVTKDFNVLYFHEPVALENILDVE